MQLLHTSCVAIDGRAVLLAGASGAGKSDLALRLIDSGAQLVSDDQTLLQREKNGITASPPDPIAGMIEIRHIGLIAMPYTGGVPVALYVELLPLDATIDRLPDPDSILLLGQKIQRLRLPGFAASTPAKIRVLLARDVL